jgi:hypothetical protein
VPDPPHKIKGVTLVICFATTRQAHPRHSKKGLVGQCGEFVENVPCLTADRS